MRKKSKMPRRGLSSIRIWFSMTQKNANSIDKVLHEEMESKLVYFTNFLHRVITTINFLAERGLPFRGKNNELGSVHNGNYMGCLEFIAKFDPFLSEHISKYGNKGKNNVSYLSSIICEDFLTLMNNLVRKKLLQKLLKPSTFQS
jgi:hypothetical protein